MKILINISNNLGGGGLQVALSFLKEIESYTEHFFFVCYGDSVKHQLKQSAKPHINYYEVKTKPLLLLSKKLKEIEKSVKPDVVFSVFGPTYWNPQAPHIMGFAIPHYLYIDSPFFKRINKFEIIKITIKKILHRYIVNRDADAIICETEDAMERSRMLFNRVKSFFTVSNTYSHLYELPIECEKFLPEKKKFRFVTISKYYSHKNLEIISPVLKELSNRNITNVEFILTIDKDDYDRLFSEDDKKNVISVGPVKVDYCPALYSECDFMFLPTLLECFSANYPEAMKMEKPILTSDLSFARGVCKNSALYFDPLDPVDIADKIEMIINTPELAEELVANGKERLLSFPTASERAKHYLEIIETIHKNQEKSHVQK